jgi:DNA mismatch repair protein MutL
VDNKQPIQESLKLNGNSHSLHQKAEFHGVVTPISAYPTKAAVHILEQSKKIPSISVNCRFDEGKSNTNKKLKILGQLFDTFIVVESGENIFFIDQHVASEKILYEHYSKMVREGGTTSEQQLIPIIIELGAEEAVQLENNIPLLNKMGFLVEPFGPDTFVVKEIPTIFTNFKKRTELKSLITDIFSNVKDKKEELEEYIISEAACQNAIKAGEALGSEQLVHLVSQLMKLDDPFRCPHGRPIIVKIGLTDLLRKFGRI